ncbi:MAG: hypothetical protein NXI27_25605 [Alphaproteobacteria bacterium]|nr:hypothetical protein [Alphaproteobacteria bacterium]
MKPNQRRYQSKHRGAKNRRHACDIHRVARQCGVKLFDGARQYRSARSARECFSPGTLRRIGHAHGEAHLALVLRLIVETKDNAKELYAETMVAVSELLNHRPDLIDTGLALFDIFDNVDLAGLRCQARDLICGLPTSHVMRTLLALEVANQLERIRMR